MDATFIISVAAMGGLGIIFAFFLVLADKKLRVEEDPVVEKILDVLPMTNCGACGRGGCHVFAEMLVTKQVPVNACVPGGQEVSDKLAELLGVEKVDAQRPIAVVLCRGGNAEAQKSAIYRGEKSCIAADLSGGDKSCVYGCLGYGDCVQACKFDAMAMNDNGLPVVFYDKCVGCAACVEACPRDLIEMHPPEHKLFVYCKSLDKGAVAKKACKVACIACKLCEKDCEVTGGITIEDNLAIVNYELCPQDDVPTKRCPTKCILYGEEEKMTRDSFYSSRLKKAV
jgi:Na+-translocating ferredoxin:NAD+ oxidoreductase RNF subunit RnfB